MHIEPAAAVLIIALLLLGFWSRAPLIALFASLPFGATAAFMLGDASVALYAPFSGLFVASVFLQPQSNAGLRRLFSERVQMAVVALLLVYVIGGSILLPRLFAGQTTVFVAGFDKIMELPLGPVPGNINQTGYFIADTLSFFAVSLFLLQTAHFRTIRVALFTFATVHVVLCLLDLGGKLAGAGDVLSVFRTAGYSMLVGVKAEGFWRIVGGYPEASTCAMSSATVLGFTFSYWRATGSRAALLLAVVSLLLLLFSTSTTGYAVLAALATAYFFAVAREGLLGRVAKHDIWILMASVAAMVGVLGSAVVDPHVLDPVGELIQSSILDKSASSSAVERAYWNYKSFQSFLDTSGLGIGIGSSRASSWIFAALSQVGLIGTLLMGLLAFELFKGRVRSSRPEDELTAATCNAVRAAGCAALAGLIVAGGNADPGVFFFASVATFLAGRAQIGTRAAEPYRMRNERLLASAPIAVET